MEHRRPWRPLNSDKRGGARNHNGDNDYVGAYDLRGSKLYYHGCWFQDLLDMFRASLPHAHGRMPNIDLHSSHDTLRL